MYGTVILKGIHWLKHDSFMLKPEKKIVKCMDSYDIWLGLYVYIML